MLLNFICFQLGWFACVLGAANHHAWLGVLIALLLLIFHILKSKNSIVEMQLILLAMLFGLLFDLIPLSLGWIKFDEIAYWPSQLPPPWMIALWGLFASTLNLSLSWLKTKRLTAIFLGAICGPLSYWAGARLNALTLVNVNFVMFYLAFAWAFAVPFLIYMASSQAQLKSLFSLKTKEN